MEPLVSAEKRVRLFPNCCKPNSPMQRLPFGMTVVSINSKCCFFDFVLVIRKQLAFLVWNSRSRLGKYSWSWLRTIGLSDYLLERTAKEKNDQGRRDPGIDIQDMENLSVFTGTGIAGKYNLCIYGSGSGGKIRSRRCGCL